MEDRKGVKLRLEDWKVVNDIMDGLIDKTDTEKKVLRKIKAIIFNIERAILKTGIVQ
jgi:hypothetical protein